MKRLFQILLILSPLCFGVDHLYLLRLGGGVSNLIGSDAPKNSKLGMTLTGGAMGAQAFYDGGPMWGTELYFSQNNVSMDTTLWSDATGDYTRKQTFDQSFTRISLGLFLMKAWDFGLAISAGPQVSYLANCIRTIDDKDYSCVDDYRIYQLDAQMDVMVFAMEPFAIDVKYAQTVLPFDKDGKSKTMLGALTLGVSYLF